MNAIDQEQAPICETCKERPAAPDPYREGAWLSLPLTGFICQECHDAYIARLQEATLRAAENDDDDEEEE